MPVTSTSASVDWSTNSGAGAWIGAVTLMSTAPRSSTGSPMTLRIRPSVALPTGIEIGAPVSMHLAAAGQAVGRIHRHGADGELAQLLRHLEHEAPAADVRRQRVQDRRQRLLVGVLDVDHGAQHLGHPSDRHVLLHTGLVHDLAPKQYVST